MKKPDNSEYTGFYVRGERQGFGIRSKPGEATYSGSWVAGKKHGFGVVITEGAVKHGLFEGDKRVLQFTEEQASKIQEGVADAEDFNPNLESPNSYW